jgi:transcriptional regulator with XRE-family HTH domain
MLRYPDTGGEMNDDLPDNVQAIASVLRDARRSRALTQAELAELLGLHRSYLADLEAGRGTLQLRRLVRALNAMGIDLVAVPRSR